MAEEVIPPERECFFITPIGKEGSPQRQRADAVLKSILEPAAQSVGFEVVRADEIAEGGQINLQVIEHCLGAASAVADLTGANPNVYYEVGMRHTARLPLALIADDNETLPADLLQQRTIFFSDDMKGTAACREALVRTLERGKQGNIDSPVDAAVNLTQLEQGDRGERAIAELVSKVDALGATVSAMGRRARPSTIPRSAVRDLLAGYQMLEATVDSLPPSDAVAEGLLAVLAPLEYIARKYELDPTQRYEHSAAGARLVARTATDTLGTTDTGARATFRADQVEFPRPGDDPGLSEPSLGDEEGA